MRLSLDVRSCRLDRRIDERIDRHLFPMQLQLAPVDPTDIQQVVDQSSHQSELPVHHGVDIRRSLRHAQLENGDPITDGSERVAQLVGQRRKKQALDGICALQLGRVLLQFEGNFLEHLL